MIAFIAWADEVSGGVGASRRLRNVFWSFYGMMYIDGLT